MSAEQALETSFLCAYFLRYVLQVAGLVNYEYIDRHGERQGCQLPVTVVFHLFEQITGC